MGEADGPRSDQDDHWEREVSDHDGHEVKCGPDCPARCESLLDLVTDEPEDHGPCAARIAELIAERDRLREQAERYPVPAAIDDLHDFVTEAIRPHLNHLHDEAEECWEVTAEGPSGLADIMIEALISAARVPGIVDQHIAFEYRGAREQVTRFAEHVVAVEAERDAAQARLVEMTERATMAELNLRDSLARRCAVRYEETEQLRAELERLTATCSCGTSSVTYEGPEPDCAVHGAVQAYNRAAAELERLRPVVEAARAWVKRIVDPPNLWADEQDFALIAAVDAFGAGPAGEEGGGDG
jgi:hypothetical protein